MRKLLSFFVMLLVSILTTTSFAQNELTRVPVFTMGESGSQYYRIPAIVETANGTLVAIADQRGSALGDLPNIISIVAKTSTDKGATWNSMVTIAQGSATAGTTYGDAVAVYDEETDKIMCAQKARGADFENGSLMDRAKALIPILVPLFISAFRRADELATAMECRCYQGGEGRTKMKLLRYRRNDLITFGVGAVLMAAVIALASFSL